MPCHPEEEFAQGPEPENPVTPTKAIRNDGAENEEPDAENSGTESDLDEESPRKQRRYQYRARTVLKYEVIKRWVRGEMAEKDDAEIQAELETEMRNLMELSGQKKFPGHRSLESDLGLWKFARSHTDKRGVTFDVYRCPMRHRCKCGCCVRVVRCADYIELQRSGLHDRNSHDNDESKKLKYDQIVSVKEAVKTAPTLSGAVLRRNLLEHHSPSKTIPPCLKRSVEHLVYRVRKDLTKQQLGAEVDDSFGNLGRFAQDNTIEALMTKHNNPADRQGYKILHNVLA